MRLYNVGRWTHQVHGTVFRAAKRQRLLNNHAEKNPVMLLNELKPGKILADSSQ
jgi:hypothetical protein